MSHPLAPTIRRLLSVAAIAVIAMGAIACSSSSDSGSSTSKSANTAAASSTDKVTIEDYAFSPKDISVKAGTKVTWTNKDKFAHSIKDTETDQDGGQNIDPSASYTHTYDKAGTYPYVCGIHPNMHGEVKVTAS